MKSWLIALFTFCLLAVCTSDAQARGKRSCGSSCCYTYSCAPSCTTVVYSCAPVYSCSTCYSSECYSCGRKCGRRCR